MVLPAYFIKLEEFKKLSPTKCRILVEKGEDPEICICHIHKIKNKKVFKAIFDKTDFIVFEYKKNKFAMIEDIAIKESSIVLEDYI